MTVYDGFLHSVIDFYFLSWKKICLTLFSCSYIMDFRHSVNNIYIGTIVYCSETYLSKPDFIGASICVRNRQGFNLYRLNYCKGNKTFPVYQLVFLNVNTFFPRWNLPLYKYNILLSYCGVHSMRNLNVSMRNQSFID